MKDLLLAGGWYQYTSCTCGGTLTQKFKHPNKPSQEFKIKPNRNQWFYFLNKSQNSNGNLSNLAAKLSTL